MTATKIPDQLIYDLEDSMTRLARLMATRHTDPDFCSGSLNLSQMMLLRAFELHDALKMSDVALLLAVKPPTASAMVDGLEKNGLVVRTASEHDRRVTLVHITEQGRQTLALAEKTRRGHMRRYLSLLSIEDIQSMIRIQNTLIDAIDTGLV
jgi:DNA-binding MarR family transcriptional regulator